MHDPTIALLLRDRGRDVLALKDLGLSGILDEEVIAVAKKASRALVTEDVKDFAGIHRQILEAGGSHAGVMFAHPKRFPRAARRYVGNLVSALDAFLAEPPDGASGSFVWWLQGPVDS